MLQMKKTITPQILCEGLPVEFELILKHAQRLKFEQRPNYRYLRGLVRTLLSRQEASAVDWEVAKGLAGGWPSKVEALVKMRSAAKVCLLFTHSFFCYIIISRSQRQKSIE